MMIQLNCEKWYKHQPEPIIQTKGVTILWNFTIQTDRKIERIRPDFVIKAHQRKTDF